MKRYLSNLIEEIIRRAETSSHILLFLDYDGTLVPICKEPSLAKLSLNDKRLLEKLSRIPWFSTGIISGRSLEEIRSLVGVKGLFYAGNHGFEIAFQGIVWVHPALNSFKVELQEITRKLKYHTRGINGILVEDKKETVSVHYRKVTGMTPGEIIKIISMVLDPYAEMFTITRGKKVYEVRPNIDWDKGKAVVKLSQLLDLKTKPLKIYIGDDQTDEDAFKVLGKDDISIRVGYKKDSKAQYFCKGSSEVLRFLKKLVMLNNSKK